MKCGYEAKAERYYMYQWYEDDHESGEILPVVDRTVDHHMWQKDMTDGATAKPRTKDGGQTSLFARSLV